MSIDFPRTTRRPTPNFEARTPPPDDALGELDGLGIIEETGGDVAALVAFDLVEDSMNEYGEPTIQCHKGRNAPHQGSHSVAG